MLLLTLRSPKLVELGVERGRVAPRFSYGMPNRGGSSFFERNADVGRMPIGGLIALGTVERKCCYQLMGNKKHVHSRERSGCLL
jgi:hypothetical protein